MEPAARKMLDEIDAFLFEHRGQEAAMQVWDVMTDTRAPDDPELHMLYKDTHTLHIRQRAFPRAMAAGALDKPYLSLKTLEGHPSAAIAKRSGSHWLSHAWPAAKALGLE